MRDLKWEQAKEEIKAGTTFLEFYTDWCGDCKMMEPVVENAKEEILKHNADVKFIKVNAESANMYQTSDEFKVMKVPSFYIVKDGKAEHIGYEYLPLEALVNPFVK